MKKLNATVISNIWVQVLFFSAVATSEFCTFLLSEYRPITVFLSLVVSLVSAMTSVKLQVNNGLLSVLGTVLGLVISFRTSSAYERQVVAVDHSYTKLTLS